MINPNDGLWLIPTCGRVNTNVRRLIRACADTFMSTKAVLVVDQADYAANQIEYDNLYLPDNFTIHVVKGGSCGQATREAMADLFTPDMTFCGWLGDDVIPETPNWDTRLIARLTGWNFVSCDDALRAPKTAGSAMLWSGDLLRAIGYVYPPDLYHMYPDTVIEEIGKATGCWTIDMSTLVRHLNAERTGAKDDTYRKTVSHWAEDDKAFLHWKEYEKPKAIERVLALMEEKGVQMVRPDLTGIEVMLATPCGSGRYENLFIESLRQTERAVDQYGGKFRFAEMIGCSDPALARIRIFGAFLRSTATHLFQIDDDQAWAPQDFVKFLMAGVDFIAAAGVRKVDPPSFAVNVSDEFGRTVPIEVDSTRGLFKVTAVGGAFVCVTRAFAERMVQQYADLAFESAEGRTEYGIYMPMLVNRRYQSEDYSVCQRWRDIGGTVWVDPSIDLRHVGSRTWSGAWITQLAAKIAEEAAAA